MAGIEKEKCGHKFIISFWQALFFKGHGTCGSIKIYVQYITICGMRIYHQLLTSGNRGLALFRAWEHAFTAWASSCSNRQWIVAASQMLKAKTRQMNKKKKWSIADFSQVQKWQNKTSQNEKDQGIFLNEFSSIRDNKGQIYKIQIPLQRRM